MSNIEQQFISDWIIIKGFLSPLNPMFPQERDLFKKGIMTNIERVQIESLARKSVVLREMWLRERQAVLTEQLAANAEVKKRWDLSDPIEVTQRQSVKGQRSR